MTRHVPRKRGGRRKPLNKSLESKVQKVIATAFNFDSSIIHYAGAGLLIMFGLFIMLLLIK